MTKVNNEVRTIDADFEIMPTDFVYVSKHFSPRMEVEKQDFEFVEGSAPEDLFAFPFLSKRGLERLKRELIVQMRVDEGRRPEIKIIKKMSNSE
jgi:hypothetical protein